jgi:uncharacterized protein
MPTAPTYPGVYIEEVPSGVRTITGVPTSITAFIGRALRGPEDTPVTINSYGDFDRIFGGLWTKSMLGFAVKDFYENAASGQAIIVRVSTGATKAVVSVDQEGGGAFELEAAYAGKWGSDLRIRTDDNTADTTDANLFNLVVAEVRDLTAAADKVGTVVSVEVHRNVSVDPASPRRVDKVLESESRLIRAKTALSTNPKRPDATKFDAIAKDKPLWGNNGTSKGASTDGDDGGDLTSDAFVKDTNEGAKVGLWALENADIFNLLCIPPYKPDGNGGYDAIDIDPVVDICATYCEKRRAMLLIDAPPDWNDKSKAHDGMGNLGDTPSKNSAIFFPRLRKSNPLRENRIETFAPCGAVAGVFARTDSERGVWKAPAGLDATLRGVPDLSVPLTDAENGELNPLGLNCLRLFPGGLRVVWGSRTRVGSDRMASEWKYIPVRRLALFLEESLYRGTKWAVFEPNDEPLWAALRLNIGAFMHNLFRQGAFQGSQARDAYFVKCDSTTTTQNDIDLGIVNVLIGFAPLKPAEFVILKFQQIAGQIQT